MYIQTIDNFVNLIGGEEVGLPLSEEYLALNPRVKNIEAEDTATLPAIGDYYDEAAGQFIPYQEHMASLPQPESAPAPTLTDVMDALRVAFGGTGDVRPAGGDAE